MLVHVTITWLSLMVDYYNCFTCFALMGFAFSFRLFVGIVRITFVRSDPLAKGPKSFRIMRPVAMLLLLLLLLNCDYTAWLHFVVVVIEHANELI